MEGQTYTMAQRRQNYNNDPQNTTLKTKDWATWTPTQNQLSLQILNDDQQK
jgi:hypothetical protein